MNNRTSKETVQQHTRERIHSIFLYYVIISIIMELVIFVVSILTHSIVDNKYGMAFIQTVIAPIMLNLSVFVIINNDIFSFKPANLKNYSVVYGAIGFVAVVVMFHGYYAWTVCYYALPIVIAALFADRTIIKRALFICIPVMYLSIGISRLLNPKVNILGNIIQGTINLVFITVIYIICNHIIDVLEEKDAIIEDYDRNEESLNHALSLDGMTTLYNHAEFNRVIEKRRYECIKKQHYMTIAVTDIDHFKRVNDTYGHEQGDKVLINVANNLMHFCSDKGQIFRYGGEEFAIIFMNMTAGQVFDVMEQVRDCLSKARYDFMPEDEAVTISTGIYKYGGESELGTHDIFEFADSAMYEAKKNGRNQCRIYEMKED